MTAALGSPALAWSDWLTLENSAIRSAGADPADRWLHVGTKRALKPHWATTVGMWGVAAPKEIMARAGVNRGAYDIFCLRHKVWSGPYLAEIKDIGPHDQFALAGAVHARLWRHRDEHGFVAAFHGLRPQEAQRVAAEFHILPVEAIQYFRAIEDVMLESGLARPKWDQASTHERRSAWVSAWGEETPVRFRGRPTMRLRDPSVLVSDAELRSLGRM